jgi:hypothetical protein
MLDASRFRDKKFLMKKFRKSTLIDVGSISKNIVKQELFARDSKKMLEDSIKMVEDHEQSLA